MFKLFVEQVYIVDRVFLAAPKLAELRYAFDTGQFLDAQGQEVSDAELATLARETAQAREAGVGLAAAKTAIATASLSPTLASSTSPATNSSTS